MDYPSATYDILEGITMKSLYLKNIVSTPMNLFYKFCKLVGHEEKDCRAYQLLKENIVDTYLKKNDDQV